MENKNINCDNCGHKININNALYNQVQKEILLEYKDKTATEKEELAISIRKEILNEAASEIESYKKQLQSKSLEIRDYNKLKASFEIATREKEELKSKIEAEYEIKISQRIVEERTKIQNELSNKNELKIAEKDHLIQQLKNQLEDSRRKIEQGSMQLQGEVQEEQIEFYLKNNFPLDSIDEIKKGARGADCIQTINTRNKLSIGSIYYESKRTKEFSNAWIQKFREDMRNINATIGVIVTDVYPKDMQRMGQREGIWICSLEEFKGLSFVLRESIIMLSDIQTSQENKGTKMDMLYNYMTGSEFRSQIEAVVEGFVQMNTDLNSEMRSMNAIWKKREKQIEKVLLNTTHIYSSVKGIAGDSIKIISALELPKANFQISEGNEEDKS